MIDKPSKEKPVIISVVSGKGGTGKTLLCAVLADMLANNGANTLVIDLDIYVRGLTSLLYFANKESLEITSSHNLAVADFFSRRNLMNQSGNKRELGISKYNNFYILPSVSTIDALLNFSDISTNDPEIALKTIKRIMNRVTHHDNYRFIIIDCRAGYDELISAVNSLSDITIAVEEDDPIANVTAVNLVKQLSRDNEEKQPFRLMNKVRNIKSKKDLDKDSSNLRDLGQIPFDYDVLSSYGSPTFWNQIYKTLYFIALSKAWNLLNQKMQLGLELKSYRFSPLGSQYIEKLLGSFSSLNRFTLFFSIILAVAGFSFAFNPKLLFDIINGYSTMEFISLLIGICGLILAFYSLLRQFKRY